MFLSLSFVSSKSFQFQNTAKQNEHCLKNFDLTEYRGIFSDIAIWLFQGIIKDFDKKLTPIIVSAMLEHDSLQGMGDSKANANRSGTFGSPGGGNDAKKGERFTIETLIKKLNEFLGILNSHGVDPEIVNQIFKHVSSFPYQQLLPALKSELQSLNETFLVLVVLLYRRYSF